MRRSLCLCAVLAIAGGAAAQPVPPTETGARPGNVIGTGMSLPRSDSASNITATDTHSELAPTLPAPPASDDIQSLLLAARQALQKGRTGEAQEALERAETRALDRSVPQGAERVVDQGPLVRATQQARAALADNNPSAAIRIINGALPHAARADIPR